MHSAFGLALATGLLIAAPARAEMLPSTPESVVEAAVDCWQAANATAVDEPGLRAKGWTIATMSAADGKPISSTLRAYGKTGSSAMLMVSAQADPRGCIVVARLNKLTDIAATAQLLLQRLTALDAKVEGKRVSPSEIAYFLLPKAAMLRVTGSPEKPGTSIQVSYTAPEKK